MNVMTVQGPQDRKARVHYIKRHISCGGVDIVT